MFCFYFRWKFSLYMSADLHPRVKKRVGRHVHTCRRCRVEFKSLQKLNLDLDRLVESPPPEKLDGFAEDIMARIAHMSSTSMAYTSTKTRIPHYLPFQRVILAGLLMIFAVCAFIRYTWVEDLLTSYELKRSVVTRDGLIVSDAQLHEQDAVVKVVKDDGDMVIIWLKTSSTKSNPPRRS